jgi:hypothetical protein
MKLASAALWGYGPAAIALLLLALPAHTSGQVPPDERYLQFETDHFRVIFPDGMEHFARRAAAGAEWAHRALSEHFIEAPSGRIALVITDYTDRPNASATPIPGNRVVLIAAPDIASPTLNYYTDWVDVTLVHELTHIFHLNRADGVWDAAQAVFGRVPFFFPAFYQPRWVIEGLPTYYESRLTGAGRAYGSSFDMLLTNDVQAGAFRTVDAADGLSPIWPAGQTPYAYGGLYFRAMAEEYGDSAVAEFVRRGSRRLPYTVNWASTPYFGSTLTGSWSEWGTRFEARARSRADSLQALGLTVGEPLSGLTWVTPLPRYSPDGQRLAFSYVTPRDDPATLVIDVESGQTLLRQRRNGSGSNTWDRESRVLYLNQAEFASRYDIYNDLYVLDVANGKERRLTRGARLASPDLAPDGRSIVAVEVGKGTNRLVRVDLDTGETRPITEFVEGVNWEHPRWSPDGARIAVERWLRGRILDIVVLDPGGTVVWQVTDDEASDVTPSWSPDGRYLLWSSDRDGAADIYAVEATRGTDPDGAGETRVWRVTRTISGATAPEVAPDGSEMVYAALYPEGIRVERLVIVPTEWEPAAPGWRALREPPTPRSARQAEVGGPVESYSPFPSLWPKSWFPVVYADGSEVGTFIGATSFGADDVRRHSYAMIAGWRTGVDDIEGAFVYRYAGFGDPLLDLGVWQNWSTVALLTADGEAVGAVERERELRLALSFLRPRVRSSFSVAPAIGLEQRCFIPTDSGVAFANPTQTDLVAGLFAGYSRARGYARSLSAEKGFVFRLELTHRRLTDDLDRWRLSAEGELRGYLSFPVFGYSNHILAARLALGASEGNQRSPELFELGGVPGRPIEVVAGLDIGGGSPYPVRGFDKGVQLGDRVVSGSIEYRLPLLLVGRGYGLWPILLDRTSLSLFVDAGSAWRAADDVEVLSAAGGELSLDLGLGYSVTYRFRLGLARQVSVPEGSSPDWNAYLGAGIAF